MKKSACNKELLDSMRKIWQTVLHNEKVTEKNEKVSTLKEGGGEGTRPMVRRHFNSLTNKTLRDQAVHC